MVVFGDIHPKDARVEKFMWKVGNGCTCYGQFIPFKISECERWLITKHKGHSAYVHRFTPVQWYCVHYDLWDLHKPNVDEKKGTPLRFLYGHGYVSIEGRLNKEALDKMMKYIAEVEEIENGNE